jgi:hypothetical protein
MDALFDKGKVGKEIPSTNELIISELDIALSLKRNKKYPYLINDERAWNEIEFLINQNKIKDKISELKNKAKTDTRGQLDDIRILKNALEDYLENCGFKIYSGYSDVIAGTEYAEFNKAVGINFVDGLVMFRKHVEALAEDFGNGKINAGLFIGIVDQKTKESIEIHRSLAELFKNFDTHIDYTTTLLCRTMAKEDWLKIIGLQNLEKTERKTLVQYLDEQLRFKQTLESLMFTEPSFIAKEK